MNTVAPEQIALGNNANNGENMEKIVAFITLAKNNAHIVCPPRSDCREAENEEYEPKRHERPSTTNTAHTSRDRASIEDAWNRITG